MPGLILVASFMKSGNTWMRALLLGLDDRGEAFQLNDLRNIGSAASRRLFDQMAGLDSRHLTLTEIANARPAMARMLAARAGSAIRLKVHDAYMPAFGAAAPPFPPDTVGAVLHLVRDPRDVAVSLAAHCGWSLEMTVERMSDPSFAIGAQWPHPTQVAQRLSDWSEHARSWLEAPFPVLTLRYEDMLTDTLGALTKAAWHIGLEASPDRLAEAVAMARFDRLQKQEDQAGFRERPEGMQRFFRRGVAGAWRDELPIALARAIEERHNGMMRHFGYLP
jgi:hypothetical protein